MQLDESSHLSRCHYSVYHIKSNAYTGGYMYMYMYLWNISL